MSCKATPAPAKEYIIDWAYLYYACITHLHWTESTFWNATHRKIDEVLKVDREVNDPNQKRRKTPNGKSTNKSEKISVSEALKRF